MKEEPIISAQDISIGYHGKKRKDTYLYENLSFNLFSGELACLLGPNGAGKSTLLRTIGNLQPLLAGRISVSERDLSTYSERSLSKIMGLVLTDKTSSGGLTIRELVELGRYPYTGFFGQLSSLDKEIVEKAMQDVGIAHKADNYVAELSDGERQKAMIAKVLSQECPIILLDEPTAFLDIESRTEIVSLLHNLARSKGKTILLSTHDIELALLLSDRLFLLSKETGIQYGITEDIILNGKLDSFFDKSIVSFDKTSGIFIPSKPQNPQKAYLKASKEIYKWAESFFNKNGYQILDDKGSCNIEIDILSPTSILINNIDKQIEFDSFEKLKDWLKH